MTNEPHDPSDDQPGDPVADPELADNPPSEPAAVEAAKAMNEGEGRQPGASAESEDPTRDGTIPDPPP